MTTTLDIQYYTLLLPPPYSYAYGLALTLTEDGVRVVLDWRYTDRDELTDEEIADEGFIADDDFFWKGTLPAVWESALQALLRDTQWVSETATDDSALSATLTRSSEVVASGSPGNRQEWEYFLQELVQAIYEAAQRERPLQIAYRRVERDGAPVQVHWEASFLHRHFALTRLVNGRKQEQPLDWHRLRPLLRVWYVPDYDLEQATADLPHRAGEYVDPGDGLWYQLDKAVVNPGKTNALKTLRETIRHFEEAGW